MNEPNVEQMMEMLRESGEVRQGLDQKSEEIKENFRQKKVDDFLRVLAAIKQSPDFARRRKFLGKYKVDKAPVYEQFYSLAKESLDPSEYAYLMEMAIYLEKSADLFSEYFNKDSGLHLKPIFQALIDGEITLPTIKEFTAFKSNEWQRWDWCVIPGQLDTSSIMFVLDRKLDSIHAKLENNGDIDWVEVVNDDRPNQYYMIAIDKISNSITRALYDPATSPDTYQADLQNMQDEFRNGIDGIGRAKLRGLTQAEYAVLQIEEIRTQIVKYDILPQEVNLYDSALTGRTVLLGNKKISDGKVKGYVTAWWSDTNRILHFGNENIKSLSYSPRLSMGFDGFNKEPNE